MKKFLLVLSCCLATWCSVQAEPKSSPEISLMQASAPAARAYAIKSVSYDPSTRVILVKFTVLSGKNATFDVQTSDGIKLNDCGYTKLDKGNDYEYESKIQLKPEEAKGDFASIQLKVDNVVRTGSGVSLKHVPQLKTSVSVGEISYDAVNKIATVNFAVYNPASDNSTLKIYENNNERFKRQIPKNTSKYQVTSSLFDFKKYTNYRIEIINGDVIGSQNFRIDDAPAGHITDVSFGKSADGYTPEFAMFKYDLKNTYNPYLYIKEGTNEYAPNVAELKIRNTNGVYVDAILSGYRSILREKTTYTAYLFDVDQNGKERNLDIIKRFTIPTEYRTDIDYPDWTFDHYTNTLKIKAPGAWPSYIKTVYVSVYYSDAAGSMCGIHVKNVKCNRDEYANIRIPTATAQGKYYIMEVTSGSYKCSLRVCIGNHLNK